MELLVPFFIDLNLDAEYNTCIVTQIVRTIP
jgi:hypothetical protein